jgi:hypothetical protein
MTKSDRIVTRRLAYRGGAVGHAVSRDNLDENGRRQSEFEAAAGSEVMIDLSREVRK